MVSQDSTLYIVGYELQPLLPNSLLRDSPSSHLRDFPNSHLRDSPNSSYETPQLPFTLLTRHPNSPLLFLRDSPNSRLLFLRDSPNSPLQDFLLSFTRLSQLSFMRLSQIPFTRPPQPSFTELSHFFFTRLPQLPLPLRDFPGHSLLHPGMCNTSWLQPQHLHTVVILPTTNKFQLSKKSHEFANFMG